MIGALRSMRLAARYVSGYLQQRIAVPGLGSLARLGVGIRSRRRLDRL